MPGTGGRATDGQVLDAYLDVFTHHHLQAKRQLPVDRTDALQHLRALPHAR